MYCPECGTKIDKDSKFCDECGANIIKEKEKENEEKVSNKKSSSKKKNKLLETENRKKGSIKKKRIIYGIIIFIVIVVCVFIGYLFKKNIDFNKPLETTWGEKYYVHLKDIKESSEDNALKYAKNIKMKFFDVNNLDDPAMEINYKIDNISYTTIYYIEKNKVNTMELENDTDIELLYSIEDEKTEYYIHSGSDTVDNYISVSEQISNNKKSESKTDCVDSDSTDCISVESTGYTFTDSDVDKVTDVNGNEISLSKFDQTFIKVNDKSKVVKLDFTKEKLDFKNVFEKAINKYVPEDELISKDEKKSIESQVKEIGEKQDEMTKAQEEVDKKKAEEEANKKITVNGHTLEFGTYKSIIDDSYFVLKKDSCTYNGISLWSYSDNVNLTCTYKLEVSTSGSPSDVPAEGIRFTFSNGKDYWFEVNNDNEFSSQWIGFNK